MEDKYFWLEPAYEKVLVFDILAAAAEDLSYSDFERISMQL